MANPLTPKNGEIGGVKKQYVYAGGGVLALAILVFVVRKNKAAQAAQAAASNAAMVTDPAGNQCPILDPNSGYCPGTPQDMALQSQLGLGFGGITNTGASSIGGQVIGFDQFGNPIFSPGPPVSGQPGSFTNNAQWTQAALAAMIQADPNINSDVIAAALGAYINGAPVTSDQQSLIQQAIALELKPPVAGPNGFPPNINTSSVNAPAPPPVPTSGDYPAPSNLHANPSVTSVTVSWSAVPDLPSTASYHLQILTSAGRLVTDRKTAQLSLLMTGLRANSHYETRVSVADSTGKHGLWSNNVAFTTQK